MSDDKEKNKLDLPYDANFSIVESIVQDLDRVGSNGMNIGDLFKGIAIKSKPLKSQALKWCKFFKLISMNGRDTKLSSLGFQYAHAIKEQKNEILIKNIPDKYATILKWISDAEGSMRIKQIKDLFQSNWGFSPNKRLSDSMLNTFARSCEMIGLIKYIKGPMPRCELTKKGFEVLSLPSQSNIDILSAPPKSVLLENDKATNKIIIISDFGKFETPLSNTDDWDFAKQRLELWKKRWEESKKTNGKNIEGKS